MSRAVISIPDVQYPRIHHHFDGKAGARPRDGDHALRVLAETMAPQGARPAAAITDGVARCGRRPPARCASRSWISTCSVTVFWDMTLAG